MTVYCKQIKNKFGSFIYYSYICIMKKETLVILKGVDKLEYNTDTLLPNRYYRHIVLEEGKHKQHLVYGIVFSDYRFKALFEPVIDRVIRDWKALGLVTQDGKPISKKAFTNLADIHEYSGGGRKLKIWYFRNSRDCIYGFYPMQGNKTENLNECYQWYLDILNGNPESLGDKDVCFGNCGIPLSYGELRIS